MGIRMRHPGPKSLCKLCLILGMTAWLWIPPGSQSQSPRRAPRETFDPLPDWRPTHVPANARYLGNEACAQCHDQATTQPATPMGRALEPVAARRLLAERPPLTFKEGPFSYSIARRGEESVYTVTDGKDSLSLPIRYAFGLGKLAQTYVFLHAGKFYEGRVSYFRRLGGLDLTPGASREAPASLAAALGRELSSEIVNDCFGCHATAAVSQGQLQLEGMTPGITCEGCHGPGERHVAAIKARGAAPGPAERQIFNPGRFDTEGLTQFCGACHRSWIQVQMMGIRGVENVRFQPYRIFNSKCYDHQDKRISCTACHNPHEELVADAASYDAKCLACHETVPRPPGPGGKALAGKAPACPKGRQNCASCHMPKTELPEMHHQFTDHQIRVVRPGDPYPN